MAERPILFSAPMVRAILSGSKTQTRRIVKSQFAQDAVPAEMCAETAEGWQTIGHSGLWWCDAAGAAEDAIRCPYGIPGDRLWVRETHAPQADCWGAWHNWMGLSRTGPKPIIHYAADGGDPFIERWRPSIHMPRWASRITLEVTSVRVERLQNISAADAIAEGPEPHPAGPVCAFSSLWRSINGVESWVQNPWVWVIEFKRLAA